MSAKQFNEIVNFQSSGLLGVSESSSDMRDLVARDRQDVRTGETAGACAKRTMPRLHSCKLQ